MSDSGPANRVLIPPHGRIPERPPSDLIWDFAGETMGTSWFVKLVPLPGQDHAVYQSGIEDELAQIIALFSPWDPTSEVSRFNTAPAGPVALSEPFWELLSAGIDLADDTDSAVDPALGALIDLWGFGPPGPRLTGAPPTLEETSAALTHSGAHRLRLDRETLTAFQPGGLQLDFGGIAKGHAVDCVSDRLTAMGATSHMVEIGGELVGRGVKPDARPWWVELEGPPGAPGPRTLAALFDIAVATSGDWIRTFDADGQSYSHTIDGRTGRPITNNVAAVTVFADTAMRADALATALTVMGAEEGLDYARDLDLAAGFIVRSANGALTESVSPAFAAMLDEGRD